MRMALFGSKKEVSKSGVTAPRTGTTDIVGVLRAPHITEKASDGMARGVYVFDVALSATKPQIKAAVKRVYNVNPTHIRVVRIPRKETRNVRTGVRGVKGGGKKAYVYLKKGDQISVM